MAIIQSGTTPSLWTIDPTSNAGRVTIYDQYGNPTGDIYSFGNVLNGLNANITMTLSGHATLGIAVTNTTGSLTLSFEATIDGYTWFALTATPPTGGGAVISTTSNGQWVASISGFYAVRTRISAFVSAASMTVNLIVTPNTSAASAQDVTGTITAIQGTAGSLTNGWPVEITDGYNILGTSAHPIKIDPTGSTIQPISGTVTANAGSGSFTIAQGTAANLNATVVGSGNFTVVQPTASNLNANVSGTVTANIGTTNGLALDTSVNGLLISQGTATSSLKGILIQGAVTTGAPTYTTAQTSPLSLTTTGAVRVDGSGTTQPVSGTITANAGTGSFTVSQTTASNLNANVSGTVTANAGTGNFTVTQATAGNLNATVIGSGNFTNASIGTNGSAPPGSSALTGASVTTSAPTYTTGQMSPLSLTTAGALRTDGSATTQPISGTITSNQGGTWTSIVSQTTPANLNATIIGNTAAGSGASSGLITVQGNASGTPIPVSGTFTTNTDGYATTGAPSYGTNTFQPLSLTTVGALRVDASATTQPISGTITANAGTGTFGISGTVTSNIGTTNGLALDATLTGGNQTTRITDGANTASVKAASIAAIGTDKALVVAVSPNNSVAVTGTFFQAIQPVSGTITANAGTGTFAVSGTVASTQSGTWTMQPGNTANTTPWLATISQGGNAATVTAGNALKIDGSGVTQPVSGTITANAGSGSFTVVQATAANLNATIVGTVTSNIGTTNGLALDTSINGLLLTQGGTTSGSKGVLIQGAVTTAAPTYTTAQTSPLSLTTAGAVRTDSSATTQPISGTITANAGSGSFTVSQGTATNLNATVVGSGNFTVVQPTASNLNATVSGTVAASQSGVWTNTVTQSTAANLNATIVGTGTAGSPSAGILTIQGNASGTPIPITGTISASNPSVTTTGSSPPASATYIGGSVTTGAPTYTTGQMSGLSLTTAGALRIDGSGATQPVSGTITANAGTGTFGVSGTVTANQGGTWSSTVTQATAANLNATVIGTVTANAGTGSFTVAQSTAGNLNATIIGNTAAGSGSATGLVTIQGNASGTAVPISGTITANAGSGSFTVAQGTAANLNATVVGTVTANAGTGSFTVAQATASNLNATVTGTVAATQSGTWTMQPGNTANTTPWLNTINQGGNSATVKAASTLAVASDTALVVSLNPASAQGRGTTANVTGVASSTSEVTILASNANRMGAIITNNSTQILYLKYGPSAAISSGNYTTTVAISNGTHEVYAGYTGIITGIWPGANGYCQITEILP